MRWNKYRLKIRSSMEDVVIASLADAGIEGVEIEDQIPLSAEDLEQMFVDIAPQQVTDDGVAYLNFYLDEEDDCAGILDRVRQELDALKQFLDVGECTIETSQTEDLDWINNWKKYFHQFYVDDILIIPSWEEVREEDAQRMIIHIDPGTAFGTGMHETTQLCIRALKAHLRPGDKLLDVGTGSGILSIAALMMGAESAVATDLDPAAVSAVRENLEANHIQENKVDLIIGNLIDDGDVQQHVGTQRYDIVTANILADVLVPLMEPVSRALKSGGLCITSGILEGKETIVEDAMRLAGMEILDITHQGEWLSVIGKKKE